MDHGWQPIVRNGNGKCRIHLMYILNYLECLSLYMIYIRLTQSDTNGIHVGYMFTSSTWMCNHGKCYFSLKIGEIAEAVCLLQVQGHTVVITCKRFYIVPFLQTMTVIFCFFSFKNKRRMFLRKSESDVSVLLVWTMTELSVDWSICKAGFPQPPAWFFKNRNLLDDIFF